MSRRNLTLLLAGLVVLAVLTLLARPGSRRDIDEQLLFPDLKAQLNDVSEILVRGPGNQLVATLRRSDKHWMVAERNYPADLGMIRANLLALAEARIVEEKTSTPDLYERLGVQDIALETARGVQLEISGTRTPIRLIIGEAAGGSSARRSPRRRAAKLAGQWPLHTRQDHRRVARSSAPRHTGDTHPGGHHHPSGYRHVATGKGRA